MKTMGKALLLGLLISGSCLQAQSKSELKERLALLESQVDQLKKALISVNNENKSLKAKAGATEKQPRAEVKYQNCDRLKDTIDEQR
ncbi:MAG: hypothetical protein CMI36_08755 [Owenweeksia sp.]|nr:hypothetical protein [Owenweeksia sp.]